MLPDELRRYDGREGRAAYIAYKGVVYDVTDNPNWEGGEHMGRLQAGNDLTPYLEDAPHGEEVFKKLPVVGVLEGVTETKRSSISHEEKPDALKRWYRKYHPHPMTVHFPIALHFFAGGMDILFLVNPSEAYELSVFYAFFVATAMGAVAMIPGVISWGVNYGFSKAWTFLVKLYVSLFTVILGMVAVYIRLEYPAVAYGNGSLTYFYHGSVFVTVASVIILGYVGGRISWSGR